MDQILNNQQTPNTAPIAPQQPAASSQPVTPPSQAPQQQTTPPAPATPPQQSLNKNKPPVFLFFLIGLIIVLGAAAYFIQSNSQQAPIAPILTQANPTPLPTEQPPATPIPTASMEEKEIDQIPVDENIDADFKTVDTDLQQL